MAATATSDDVYVLLAEAKRIAKAFKDLTGKPLGVTGEVGEYEVRRHLGFELAPAREAGFDAVRPDGAKVQIKTRCLPKNAKSGQQIGIIRLEKPWDTVVLVLLDEDLEPIEIWEATRASVSEALLKPGGKARNERGVLSVSKFKQIGVRLWSR